MHRWWVAPSWVAPLDHQAPAFLHLLWGTLATNAIARPAALAAKLCRLNPPFRRWMSRTDALELALKARLFGGTLVGEVKRPQPRHRHQCL